MFWPSGPSTTTRSVNGTSNVVVWRGSRATPTRPLDERNSTTNPTFRSPKNWSTRLWHQMPKGKGGQEGAQIAFSPEGKYLFLSVGDYRLREGVVEHSNALDLMRAIGLDV